MTRTGLHIQASVTAIPDSAICEVVFFPDLTTSTIVTLTAGELKNGKNITFADLTLPEQSVYSVYISTPSSNQSVNSDTFTIPRVYTLRNTISTTSSSDGSAHGLSFTSDGSLLAVTYTDTVKIYSSVTSGSPVPIYSISSSTSLSISLSRNNGSVLAIVEANVVKVYKNTGSGYTLFATMAVPSSGIFVNTLHLINGEGSILCVAYTNNTLKFYDTTTSSLPVIGSTLNYSIYSLSSTIDGSFLFIATGDRGLVICERTSLATYNEVVSKPEIDIRSIASSNNGDYLLVTSSSNAVKMYNRPSRSTINEIAINVPGVNYFLITCTSDAQTLAIMEMAGLVRIITA